MTREEAKELLPIIKAFAEGKTLEFLHKSSKGEIWFELDDPDFSWNANDYRIKPESNYRLFKDIEECWNEMLKHQPFGWLKNKKSGGFSLIGNVYQGKEVWFVWATSGGNAYSAYDLFNDYVFIDGTPFGIKEE